MYVVILRWITLTSIYYWVVCCKLLIQVHAGGKHEDDMFHFCIQVLDQLYIPWKDWQIHKALCWRRFVWYFCNSVFLFHQVPTTADWTEATWYDCGGLPDTSSRGSSLAWAPVTHPSTNQAWCCITSVVWLQLSHVPSNMLPQLVVTF